MMRELNTKELIIIIGLSLIYCTVLVLVVGCIGTIAEERGEMDSVISTSDTDSSDELNLTVNFKFVGCNVNVNCDKTEYCEDNECKIQIIGYDEYYNTIYYKGQSLDEYDDVIVYSFDNGSRIRNYITTEYWQRFDNQSNMIYHKENDIEEYYVDNMMVNKTIKDEGTYFYSYYEDNVTKMWVNESLGWEVKYDIKGRVILEQYHYDYDGEFPDILSQNYFYDMKGELKHIDIRMDERMVNHYDYLSGDWDEIVKRIKRENGE